MIRPAEHLVFSGDYVLVSGRVCVFLDSRFGLDTARKKIRGMDAELDHTLQAIHRAALTFKEGSPSGTCVAPQVEPAARSQPQLNPTVSTTTAADFLGITRRAVLKACTEKRLPAAQVDGRRWRITRDDLINYKATRSA